MHNRVNMQKSTCGISYRVYGMIYDIRYIISYTVYVLNYFVENCYITVKLYSILDKIYLKNYTALLEKAQKSHKKK